MVWLIVLVLVVIGFVVMPKHLRWLNVAMIAGLLGFAYYVKFGMNGQQSVSQIFGVVNFGYATIGVFILSIVLTIMQSRAPSMTIYKAKRNQLFIDLAKLGGLYFAITMAFRVVVYLAYGADKDAWDISWAYAKLFGLWVFLAVIALYYITKGIKQNKTQAKN